MLPRASLLLAVAAVALTACGSDDTGSADPVPTTGATAPAVGTVDVTAAEPATAAGWSYTDGAGRTVELEERPERIVAHASSAAALISLGVRPVGIYADTAVTEDLALRDVDLTGIEIVGEEWGVINLEAVAALEPDLIVAEWWPVEQAYSGLEPGTEAASRSLTEIAPVAGPAQGDSIATMLEDYEALAALLGADLDDPAVAASRERFAASLDAFRAAVAAKPDLSVLAVSPAAESLYVAVPEHAAELADFVRWGLDVVVPTEPDEGFEYWQTLSWENAATYQADLVIVDERGHPGNVEAAEAQPTWATLDAVAAGAVAVWPAFWVRTHDDYAEALDELTAAIDAADEDLITG